MRVVFDTNIFVAILSKFLFAARRPHTNDNFLLGGHRFRISRGFGEVDIQVNPTYSFTLITAHLKSKRPVPQADEAELRLEEAKLLRELIDARLAANPNANLVVLGDLNDTKDSASTRVVIGRGKNKLVDTRPAERNGDNTPSANPAWEPRKITWTHYYGKEDTYSRIDDILVSPGLAREWATNPDPRTCDRDARRLLRKRASSVFPVPCRAAIYAKDYDEAITTNERLTGKRIFRAAWNIVPRLREVDELLLSDKAARGRIREGHPEVCFWALAGGRPMQYKKKSEAGFAERREVLQAAYPPVQGIIAAGLDWLKGKAASQDDLLDALAAAVTGALGQGRLRTLPEAPPLDARGLAMEMVYYLPSAHNQL